MERGLLPREILNDYQLNVHALAFSWRQCCLCSSCQAELKEAQCRGEALMLELFREQQARHVDTRVALPLGIDGALSCIIIVIMHT